MGALSITSPGWHGELADKAYGATQEKQDLLPSLALSYIELIYNTSGSLNVSNRMTRGMFVFRDSQPRSSQGATIERRLVYRWDSVNYAQTCSIHIIKVSF